MSTDSFETERAALIAARKANTGANAARRAKASREAVAALLSSARRIGYHLVTFDHRPLFGPIAADTGAPLVALGIEGISVIIERAKLAKIATTLRTFPRVEASFSPRPDRPVVSLRWARADGTGGGIDLTGVRLAPGEKASTAVVFPADLPEHEEAAPFGASPRPVWSTPGYIAARLADQLAAREERERAAKEAVLAVERARVDALVRSAHEEAPPEGRAPPTPRAVAACGRPVERARQPSAVMVEAGRKAWVTRLRNAAARGDTNAAAKLAVREASRP